MDTTLVGVDLLISRKCSSWAEDAMGCDCADGWKTIRKSDEQLSDFLIPGLHFSNSIFPFPFPLKQQLTDVARVGRAPPFAKLIYYRLAVQLSMPNECARQAPPLQQEMNMPRSR